MTLKATLDKQIHGCFVSCGWSSAEQLQPDQTDERPTRDTLRPWNPSVDAWWSVTSHDVFHAVYHDSAVGRVQWPARRYGMLDQLIGIFNYYPFFFHLYFYHHCVHLPLLRLLHLKRACRLRWPHLLGPPTRVSAAYDVNC